MAYIVEGSALYERFLVTHFGENLTLAFVLRLWPSSSVKVTFIFTFRWTLCCCVLVPRMKFVGSIEFEMWTIVWRKLKWRHNNVIMTSSSIQILWNLNTNRPRVYLIDIPNFIWIKHKTAEILGREVNRELWIKNWYYVTVILTFDQRSPKSIGSEPVREATI